MRSVTSCFNSTLYRKTMARFWPLWALYSLVWAFLIPFSLINTYVTRPHVQGDNSFLEDCLRIPNLLGFGVVLAMVMGVLVAMAVFGYLYSHRSAAMMHALPMKRDTLFFTQYMAGLSFLLLPNLAIAAVTALIEVAFLPSAFCTVALKALLLWLLAQSGICLFFFSFASLCAMFTGNTLALPAFYGIFNALVLVIHSLISLLASSFFYGLPNSFSPPAVVRWLTPVWNLTEASTCDALSYAMLPPNSPRLPTISLYAPKTIAVYALVGVGMAAVALLLYRQRHVETAEDVVAVPLLRPVFLVGVSFCTGLCFGWGTSTLFFGWDEAAFLTVSIVIWAVIGWFVAAMFLKRSFRVLPYWKGAVVMAVCMTALCTAFLLDFFGVESRVPSPESVKELQVSSLARYPFDSGNQDTVLTDPEQIAQFVALHQAIVDNRNNFFYDEKAGYENLMCNLRYTLKNGSVLQRFYSVPIYKADLAQEGSVAWLAQQIANDRSITNAHYGLGDFKYGHVVSGTLDMVWNPKDHYLGSIFMENASPADLARLWQAVQDDFAEGTLGERNLFSSFDSDKNAYRTELMLDVELGDRGQGFSITLTANAKHTLAWIEEMNILGDEYVLATNAMLQEAGLYD